MHAAKRMLTALCVLLPAVVVAHQSAVSVSLPLNKEQIRPVAGTWAVTVVDGSTAVMHDGKKWTGKEGFPLALFRAPRVFSDGKAQIDFKLIDGTDDHTAGLVFGHAGGPSYFYVRYNTKDGNVALWRMDGPKRTVIKHGEHHEQLEKGKWHQLELTVEGKKILAVVNRGALRVEHELDAPVSGNLGLWTKPDATTAFRNLRAAPAATAQGPAETVTIRSQAPIGKTAGVWVIEGDAPDVVFTHDGTKWTAKEGFPLAVFREPREFANGSVSVDFKLIAGGDDHTAGLVFGHDGESYYYARYNTKDGNVALWRMEGPTRTVVKHGEVHEQLPKDQWHRLELTVSGRKVRASVAGRRLAVEHEFDEPLRGSLGLWTKPDATSAFRNLVVRPR